MRIPRGRTFLLASLCLAANASAESVTVPDPFRFIIMDSDSRNIPFQLCSRFFPAKVFRTWTIRASDAFQIDGAIDTFLQHNSRNPYHHGESPLKFRMQMLGIVVGSDSLVYVNGYPRWMEANPKTKNRVVLDVCDGGDGFWGVVWNPHTHTFSDLQFNGEG